jgi:hypothetical protein
MIQLTGHTSANNYCYAGFDKRIWVNTRPYYGQRIAYSLRSPLTSKWLTPKHDNYFDIVLLFGQTTMQLDPGQIAKVKLVNFKELSDEQFQRFCNRYNFDQLQQEIISIHVSKHYLKSGWKPSFRNWSKPCIN